MLVIVLCGIYTPIWAFALAIIGVGVFNAFSLEPQGPYDFFTPMLAVGIIFISVMTVVGIVIGACFF
ncbi:hypothetical protein [Bacillus thuringiensis]|uniref:hypothetical protein n=1 Tax=Bacillus thuringiensis TaxID=1428 RepID=UPI000A3BB3C4|nr:hypothetical protein [Bacillus thuringiensis]OUA88836.1 hypothetical protein BK706_17060 [Bacillus thuringiensis serovar leesis]